MDQVTKIQNLLQEAPEKEKKKVTRSLILMGNKPELFLVEQLKKHGGDSLNFHDALRTGRTFKIDKRITE